MAGISAVSDDITSNVFYTRTRVKSVDSILNKVRVKRRESGRESYSIDEIGDIAGVRFVTLYDDQLEHVFESILRTIYSFSAGVKSDVYAATHLSGLVRGVRPSTPLFWAMESGSPIDRIKVYRRKENAADFYNRLANYEFPENVSAALAKLLKDKIVLQKMRSDSYSSVHILTRALSYGIGSVKTVPLEIQIRTVAEDIWCEVSHGNKYKAKDLFFWSKNASKSFELIKGSTNNLKTHIDGINEGIRTLREHKKSIDGAIEEAFQESGLASSTGSSLIDLAFLSLGTSLNDETLEEICQNLRTKYGQLSKVVKSSYWSSLLILLENTEKTLLNREILYLEEIENYPSYEPSSRVPYDYCALINAIFIIRLEVVRVKTQINCMTASNGRRNGVVKYPWHELMKNVEEWEADQPRRLERVADWVEYNAINPRVIINYIKYRIAENIDEVDDDFAYLSSAFELLQYDKTIYKNSITRLRIQREYALYLWLVADGEEITFSDLNFALNSRIENLKNRFLQSFLISIDLLEQHKKLMSSGLLKDDIESLFEEEELYLSSEILVRSYLSAVRYTKKHNLLRSAAVPEEFVNKTIEYCLDQVAEYRDVDVSFLFTRDIYDYLCSYRPRARKRISEAKRRLRTLAEQVSVDNGINAQIRGVAAEMLGEQE